MPRQAKTFQFDLFSSPYDPNITQTPRWQTLPAETRQTLTALIARLFLDHAYEGHLPAREEMRDDD